MKLDFVVQEYFNRQYIADVTIIPYHDQMIVNDDTKVFG